MDLARILRRQVCEPAEKQEDHIKQVLREASLVLTRARFPPTPADPKADAPVASAAGIPVPDSHLVQASQTGTGPTELPPPAPDGTAGDAAPKGIPSLCSHQGLPTDLSALEAALAAGTPSGSTASLDSHSEEHDVESPSPKRVRKIPSAETE